jgi:hypothetical protein
MENKHLEDSPSSNRWNRFKRQVVSYISRAHEVIGSFFFQGKIATNANYPDMLELYAAAPQMAHLQAKHFLSTRWCPSTMGLAVREFTKQIDWAGRTNPLVPSLPRYNTIGFFLLDQVFLPKCRSLLKLRAGINNFVASVTPQILENTWRDIEYRLDILRATNSAHIEKY